jgi:pilus assembly protein CpaF
VTSRFDDLRVRVQGRMLGEAVASGSARRLEVRATVARLLAEEDAVLSTAERASLEREIADAVIGLGALEPLLRDPHVGEIMVNGPDAIYVERDGRIERTDVSLGDADAVMHLIDRIVGPLGLRVDGTRPWVDARLPDGSRAHAIIPPLAVGGPVLTIRKFGRAPLRVAQLEAGGALSPGLTAFLRSAVRARTNVMVSGGAGAGKTTLLNALSSFIPPTERIVTIEDAAELRLQQEHVVSLEARPANVEGVGAVGLRELVRNALRMRPDRIVVGEVRGAEALDMLHAMNTGHQGSMSTAHANSPGDLVTRLEAMVLMGDVALPLPAVRAQIVAGLDLIVHVERSAAGMRRITEIAEVRGDRDGRLSVVPLVRFASGSWEATGNVARCLARLRAAGEPAPSLLGGRP